MARGNHCVRHDHYDRFDHCDHDGFDYRGHYDLGVLDVLLVRAFRGKTQLRQGLVDQECGRNESGLARRA